MRAAVSPVELGAVIDGDEDVGGAVEWWEHFAEGEGILRSKKH